MLLRFLDLLSYWMTLQDSAQLSYWMAVSTEQSTVALLDGSQYRTEHSCPTG